MRGCRPLTDAEIERVLTAFAGPTAARDRALFLLGLKAGFRVSELLSLRLGDVLQAGRIAARVSVARRHVKGRAAGRTVLLHPAARAALAAWVFELRPRGGVAPDAWLFRSQKGTNRPISRGHAWRILRRAFAAAGVAGNLGTHVMRKTFADRIYDRLGRDLVKTQRALGHRCIESTAAYISFRQEEIDEAILSL